MPPKKRVPAFEQTPESYLGKQEEHSRSPTLVFMSCEIVGKRIYSSEPASDRAYKMGSTTVPTSRTAKKN